MIFFKFQKDIFVYSNFIYSVPKKKNNLLRRADLYAALNHHVALIEFVRKEGIGCLKNGSINVLYSTSQPAQKRAAARHCHTVVMSLHFPVKEGGGQGWL